MCGSGSGRRKLESGYPIPIPCFCTTFSAPFPKLIQTCHSTNDEHSYACAVLGSNQCRQDALLACSMTIVRMQRSGGRVNSEPPGEGGPIAPGCRGRVSRARAPREFPGTTCKERERPAAAWRNNQSTDSVPRRLFGKVAARAKAKRSLASPSPGQPCPITIHPLQLELFAPWRCDEGGMGW